MPIRKPGKLPAETIEESYEKEYGKDTVQMHKDAIDENDVILLHDDLLATGGTMAAACKLVKQMNPKKIYVNFIIELQESARQRCLRQGHQHRKCSFSLIASGHRQDALLLNALPVSFFSSDLNPDFPWTKTPN